MDENYLLSKGIREFKSEFSKTYKGSGHIREVMPLAPSDIIPIKEYELNMLHKFAQENPIYFNSYDIDLLGIPSRVYEADINQYWLDSIKHDSSCQSFYPTWIISAYALSTFVKKYGFTQAIDIGSGDGRIPYCTQLAKIKTTGIEIDKNLVKLQHKIIKGTDIHFDAITADATTFDYTSLNISKPVFFISGLPEMGGEMLAEGVINSIKSKDKLRQNTHFIFMGKTPKSDQKEYKDSKFGWDHIIDKHGLKLEQTIWLPTHWTTEQDIDTPHLYVSF
jgi:hypothetical protein